MISSDAGTTTVTRLPALEPRQLNEQVPLTFTQQAHWRSYVAGERPIIREVACALLVRGPLDEDALRRASSAVALRHEALRTRIEAHAGNAIQQIAVSAEHRLFIEDLRDLPHRDRELRHLWARMILEPVDLRHESPLSVGAAKLASDQYVLIVAMNHLIGDAQSLRIVCDDLLRTYEQNLVGCAGPRLEPTVQFADFAVWQQRTHQLWLKKHAAYWQQRLAGCGKLSFPQQGIARAGIQRYWERVDFTIAPQLKAELQDWSRAQRTTLTMSIFTAYVGLLLRWCGVSEAVVRFQIDGRANAKVQHTVGFFASLLSLRIELRPQDSFVDLLRRVTSEYCNACAHADAGYLDTQQPIPQFSQNPIFNWIPRIGGPSPRRDAYACISPSTLHWENPALATLRLDNEPIMTLQELVEQVEGELAFPPERFSMDAMRDFTRNFLEFLGELSQSSTSRVMSLPIRQDCATA